MISEGAASDTILKTWAFCPVLGACERRNYPLAMSISQGDPKTLERQTAIYPSRRKRPPFFTVKIPGREYIKP